MMLKVLPLFQLLLASAMTMAAPAPNGSVEAPLQPHPTVAAAWLPASQAEGEWQSASVIHEATGETSEAILRKEKNGTQLLWKAPSSKNTPGGYGRFRYTLAHAAPTQPPALQANLLDPEALATPDAETPPTPLPRSHNVERATVQEKPAVILGAEESDKGEPGYTTSRVFVEPGHRYHVDFDYRLDNAPLHSAYGLSLYVWLYFLDDEGQRTFVVTNEKQTLHRVPVFTTDATHTQGWKHHRFQVVIPHGVGQVELEFRAATGGERRAVAISGISLAPSILARARDAETMALEAAGGRYFDFGPAASPVFERFEAVTPKDHHTPDRGWGFTKITAPTASDNRRPEALGGDFISASEAVFRVDVPDGKYDIWCLAGDVSSNTTVRRYYFNSRLRVNGHELYHDERDPAETLLDGGLYYGYNRFWKPGADYYRDFVAPLFREWRTTVDVRDGTLTLQWSHLPMAAVVILPAEAGVPLQKVVETIAAERRRDTSLEEVPPPPAREGDWKPNARENERGYALYSRDTQERLYPYARPIDQTDRLASLEGFATPGEVKPFRFSLHGLADKGNIQAEASALEGKAGRIEPETIKVSVARYLFCNAQAREEKGGYRYQLRAVPLDKPRPLPVRKGLNWTWWLHVTVPESTRPGVYTGSVRLKEETGAETVVPVRLRVLGFELEPLPIVHGFYYTPSEPWYAFFWHRNVYGSQLKEEAPHLRDLITQQERRELAAMKTLGINSASLTDDLRGDLSFSQGEIALREGDRFTLWMDLYKEAGFGPMPFFGMGAYGPTPGAANRLSWLDDSLKPPYSPAWKAAYPRLVEMLETVRRERDWPEILYYISDERSNYGKPGADLGAEVAALLQPLREQLGIRTIASMNGPHERVMVPHLDISMPNYAFPIEEDSLQWIAENESQLWLYNVGWQRLTAGVWTWRMNAKGRFQWHYRAQTPYVWDDVANPSPAQTRYSISYPTPDGPIFTLDGEEARAGITDHRYLATLETAIAASKGNPVLDKARQEAELFLNDLRERLPVDARKLIRSDDPKEAGGEIRHGLNGSEALERVRWAIATHILKLKGKEEVP